MSSSNERAYKIEQKNSIGKIERGNEDKKNGYYIQFTIPESEHYSFKHIVVIQKCIEICTMSIRVSSV